jgi:ATP phosphoribosyltransferase
MTAPMLRVALAKGRLYDLAAERFAAAGAAPSPDAGRRLLVPSSNPQVEFLTVKPGDVPVYVESGAADLGVTGTDVLREANPDVLEPLDLGFGACRLVVATPATTAYPSLGMGLTPRVATKYPRLAREHFNRRGIAVEIIAINGSVEVAPLLRLSHWIVDLVDTGNTLRANGLIERETILDCTATVVVNRAAHKLKLEAVERLLQRLAITS